MARVIDEDIVEKARKRGLQDSLAGTILNGQGRNFLEALAAASFDTRLTDLLLPTYHPLLADVAQRWFKYATEHFLDDEIVAVSCIARVLPFATYLAPVLKRFFASGRLHQAIAATTPSAAQIDNEHLQLLLTAVFRLLSHDLDAFSGIVQPVFLCSLFSHGPPHSRLLAVECFCRVMRFADAFTQELIHKYVGTDAIIGPWEDEQIDYRILKLYEERRWQQLQQALTDYASNASQDGIVKRFDHLIDLSEQTVSVADVLIPLNHGTKTSRSAFVLFPTSYNNLNAVAATLHRAKPTLIVGSSGAGKTSIIREIAQQTNMLASMVTLHLNDQTDAKSLLGIYTSSVSGSGFAWQPGVLTKAVQEGRYVLIEDIDRAPAEVLGLLRPLVENNELFLPSRKERLRPADGFQIFGTIRSASTTSDTASGIAPVRNAFLANERLWSVVKVQEYSPEEISQLLRARFPNLAELLGGVQAAHVRIIDIFSTKASFKATQNRVPSIRDLLKWCRRLSRRMTVTVSTVNPKTIPGTFMIDILKDGVDCYAAHLSDPTLVEVIALTLAECLNISPAAAEHALKNQNPIVQEHKDHTQIGRSSLLRTSSKRIRAGSSSRFALTRRVRHLMETITSAAAAREPLLLAGETGVGKTTLLQYIASSIDQDLVVVNLSNQSEASDLLGGLKPITTRSLFVPMLDAFDTLFDETFSAHKNEKFRQSVSKCFHKQRWSRLVGLWEEAVQLALKSLPTSNRVEDGDTQISKRRKLDSHKYLALRKKWANFANTIDQAKAQIHRGEKNQVFAFVESRLVQAIRNGTWLLLDEINLASSETLDSILSLLSNGDDETPYLLLSEAGNIEKINAHPNFRIFAAMNPATDTGKKDLPPAIRTHFTEIYVQSGDGDLNDLVEIIKTYLGAMFDHDKRAASDLAKAYLALKQLNVRHKLTDGTGENPHFSLRSLTRSLQFVQLHAPTHGLRKSMLEGMQMSFFTVLDLKSQQLALPAIEQYLMASAQAKKTLMAQKSKITIDTDRFVAFEQYSLGRGSVEPSTDPHYIVTPSVRRNLTNLARAASMRRFPILLQGPTSAGKTSMVEYLAKYSGNEFVRINNHEHTDLQEYLGSYASGADGRLEYREGVLVDALRNGHWIVLDELNLAPSDVLEALNRLLDDNRELLIPESQEIVRPHPNFMLFATQNPAGLYGGRKRLSRAFRNRFLEIHVNDIPEEELETILKERAQIAPSFCRQIVEVYKKLSLQRQSSRLFESKNSFATLRDLFRWASRPVHDREQLAYHGYMLLAERVRDPAEKAVVKTTIEEILNIKIDDASLYNTRNLPQTMLQGSGITWTRAMCRLYVLVATALKNNEPVLLVGETGCGKTQVCQCIAEAFGKQLSIYNAHSNTESGDLIGSQRPVRHKSELAEAVNQDLQALGDRYTAMRSNGGTDVDELIAQFKAMDTTSFEQEAVRKVQNSIAAYQSLFAWSDGSLVRAMKDGSYFLLDEISLADDSVLERMNSLLEPARSILLAEKGAIDNFVVAAPGFQFLATMNPGGDYGKRELSAALRNRLTEIWVPPLSDNEDIVPILNQRLSSVSTQIAPTMVEFARFFRSAIQSSTTATIPLRTLLSWADFVVQNVSLGVENALVCGAAMTYVDSLGADPAGMTSVANHGILEARQLCLRKLGQLFNVNAEAVYNAPLTLTVDATSVQIGTFQIARLPGASDQPDLAFEASATLRNAMRIVRALQTNRPLLLEGNPGVGKTAIVSALAKLCGKHLTRVNLSDQTDLMDLFGADAPTDNEKLGRFTWRDGPLLQAMQNGGWVLLDEMNLASQSVLEGLNACLDHRQEIYIAELDKTFKCHSDFTLFATQNPHHQGGGRKGLPASFVNRFTVVYADPFSKEDLLYICKAKNYDIPEELIQKLVETVDICQTLSTVRPEFAEGGPWELNLRDLNRWLSLCAQKNFIDPGIHFKTVVTDRFRNQKARLEAVRKAHQTFGTREEESMYRNLGFSELQFGTAFLARDTFRQRTIVQERLPTSHLHTAKSIVTALNNNWPVVIVGSSGSGKTSVIRSLAGLSGQRVVEFSITADTDTADLIGGFEQYDAKREVAALQSELKDVLVELLRKSLDTCSSDHLHYHVLSAYSSADDAELSLPAVVSALRPIVDRIDLSGQSALQLLVEKLQALQNRSMVDTTRFVWNDGILLDALQAGHWLVLDNANLCNPSVLDRLNPLLEPNGCLIVSEQHGANGEARVLRPHPNFRIILTMDPRYGELSRAMRNRSLEIFVDAQMPTMARKRLPKYPEASGIARLQEMWAVPAPAPATIEACEPLLSFLSEQDLRLGQVCAISKPMELARAAMMDVLVDKVGIKYPTTLSADLTFQKRFERSEQPVVRLVNEPVFQTCVPSANRRDIYKQALPQLTVALLLQIQQQLIAIESEATSISKRPTSLLQKSVPPASKTRSKRAQEPAVPAFSFLQGMVQLCLMVAETFQGGWPGQDVYTVFADTVNLTRDLFTFFNAINVPAEQITAYTIEIEHLGDRLSALLPQHAEHFAATKQVMGDNYTLKSGQYLQQLWPTWKGPHASSAFQIETTTAMHKLISRFDELCQSLPQRRSELANVRTRLLEAQETLVLRDDAYAQMEILTGAIDQFAKQKVTYLNGPGLFSSTFNHLAQKIGLHSADKAPSFTQQCALFGNIPASDNTSHRLDLSRPSQILAKLAMLNEGVTTSETERVPPTMLAVQSIAGELEKLHEQPISRVNHAQEEFTELVRTFSPNTKQIGLLSLPAIRKLSTALLWHALVANSYTAEQLQTVDHQYVLDRSSVIDNLIDDKIAEEDIEYAAYLQRRCESITDQPSIFKQQDSYDGVGKALVITCLLCLKFLVPDKVFDPATHPMLVRNRYVKRIEELETRVTAWRAFQLQTTGQESSAVIEVLNEQVSSLGKAPSVPDIYRPDASQLIVLQAEFTNVLRSVVSSGFAESLADGDFHNYLGAGPKLLHRAQICVDRLSQMHRAYDDLVKPVIGLLQGMIFGVRMIGFHVQNTLHKKGKRYLRTHKSDARKRGRQAMLRIKHLTSSLELLRKDTRLHQNFLSLLRAPQVWSYLRVLRVKLAVGRPQGLKRHQLVSHIVKVIDELWKLWWNKLGEDRTQAEEQSKYYAYRGQDDDEINDADVQAMFPQHETDDDNAAEDEAEDQGSRYDSEEDEDPTWTRFDVRKNAIELASYHRRLFHTEDATQLLQSFMAQRLAAPDELHPGTKREDVLSEENMMNLLLLMEQKLETFSSEPQVKTLNIFTDADINETRKLFDITAQAISRFQEIAEAWPDHAVPGEVLAFCSQVMALRMSDPVTKLLTKTEKLLDVVSQWQAVASREWSVANIVDSLTNLIIHWRRLELASWSRLLDLEDDKQQENADAWYFIAYEAIIQKPLEVIDQEEKGPSSLDRTYSSSLAKTLEDFLRNTTLGQFSKRLELLRCFGQTIKEMADECFAEHEASRRKKATRRAKESRGAEVGVSIAVHYKEDFISDGYSDAYDLEPLSFLQNDTSSIVEDEEPVEDKNRGSEGNSLSDEESVAGQTPDDNSSLSSFSSVDTASSTYTNDEEELFMTMFKRERGDMIMKIHDTVMNVVNHFSRYEAQVQKCLSDGRSVLEKKITEQIKLASWKDTNPTALKESVRRSHYKLFRIVKSYRTLLGQPITNFNAIYATATDILPPQNALALPQSTTIHMPEHIEACENGLDGWAARPERLRDTVGAGNTMRHAYMSTSPFYSETSELSHYLANLSSSVKELRKATPSIANEDNKSLVRDLKQRKRRLLADTMKDIAQMGIRRNLGTTELDAQSSCATMLARVPLLAKSHDSTLVRAADAAFYQLIDVLPTARQAGLEHSEELTDGETRRALGYLEGLMSLVLSQRISIGNVQQRLERNDSVSSALDNLGQRVTSTTIQECLTPKFDHYRHLFAYLPALLNVCAQVADFQGQHGKLETKNIASEMRGFAVRLEEMRDRIAEIPHLPYLVLSEQEDKLMDDCVGLKEELQVAFDPWIAQESQIEHLVLQLRKWTDVIYLLAEGPGGSYVQKVSDFDMNTQKFLNQLFVALQEIVNLSKQIPSSTEDQGWLAKASDLSTKITSSLHLDALTNGLDDLLNDLQYLEAKDFHLGLSVLIITAPIVKQFGLICRDIQTRMLYLHLHTTQLAVFLGQTFTTIAREGFCSPSESSDGQEQTGKVEQGTGLGEGDAAEDISKDVGDDEDLSELAQQEDKKEQDGEEMDKCKDAIDMETDDLEGEMGSGDEQVSDDENDPQSGEEDAGQDMDEETGSVDELDPSAVDEKMWDDMKNEAEKEEEMKSEKPKGGKTDDQAARQEGAEAEEDSDDLEANEPGDKENEDEDGEQKAEGENLDPHLQEEQALDLPEEMQLNGEEEKKDDISDADMDAMSDVDVEGQADKEQVDLLDEDKLERDAEVDQEEEAQQGKDEDMPDGKADDDEIVEDQAADEQAGDDAHDQREDDKLFDVEDQENGDAGLASTNQADLEAQEDDHAPQGHNNTEAAAQEAQPQQGKQSSTQQQSGTDQGAIEQGIGRQEAQTKQNEALKRLADVLEDYHQRREIFTANKDRQQEKADQDTDMADADFEHLEDPKDDGDAQALGTANNDAAQNHEQAQAIEENAADVQDDLPMPEESEKQNLEQQENMADKFNRLQGEREERESFGARNAILPESAQERPKQEVDIKDEPMILDEQDLDQYPTQTDLRRLQYTSTANGTASLADAQHLWSLTSNKTQSLSLTLTEQLRLILQPTTATKLRGDFRTGKRLNIRRIIPYIASGYKRDKIWMRRSVPSKRNYQVMLAVDDSRSMQESGADILALETLCMLSRSLSMLEVGELCVVAFGKDYNNAAGTPNGTPNGQVAQAVKIAHPFSAPFSPSTSGPETFTNFTFQQTGTNIRALLAESLSLFQNARLQSTAREATDLWQLQIIISDGHIGSDADDGVRRLVRKAREERVVVVFVVVDAGEESIVDLKEVSFEEVDNGIGGRETKMITKRYLEGFPFQYYVVVREVRDLPGVLARVLRGWFEGIVEQG